MAKITLNDKSIRRAPPAAGQIELWDKLTPGFGLRIAAGGARTYFVMKRLNGKLVRRTVGKAPPPDVDRDQKLPEGEFWPHDAREKARQLLSDLARGIDATTSPGGAAVSPQTFGQVAAAYFKDPAKRGGAALKSKSELERKVRVDLKAWSDRPIAGITRADIRAMISEKHEKSPVSANRLLALVRRIFRWAVREELIAANPAMDIEPTEETERERVLTMGELAQVWAGAETMGYPYGPLIKTLMLTAQRRSEVAAMRWSEVDGAAWRLPDERAKRGKGHLVPLSPRAASILKSVPKMGDKPVLVFTTGLRQPVKTPADGEPQKPLPPAPVSGWSRMKTRLDGIIARAAAVKALKLPCDATDTEITKAIAAAAAERKESPAVFVGRHAMAPWTLHDIRRSVSTHLRDGDVMGKDQADRLTVSKILNHAEGGMTRLYDRYSADPEQRRALEAWADRVERLCGLNVIPMEGARA